MRQFLLNCITTLVTVFLAALAWKLADRAVSEWADRRKKQKLLQEPNGIRDLAIELTKASDATPEMKERMIRELSNTL